MAGKTLVVATKFTAADKYSTTLHKMTAATTKFGKTAVGTFNRIERAERRLRKGISGLLGKIGSLGLAFGGLALAMNIGTATVQLEENLASLSAITGVTGTAFEEFEKQIDAVSQKQRVFSGDTAKAFEIVGSAKPELLGNAAALAEVTDAVITLSKASKDDLTVSAQNLTGAMNQFSLGSTEASRVINALAAGSQAGAANISEVNESLKGFGAVANAANITLEESIGLVETLAIKQLKGSEAGTALRGTILRLQAAGLGYKSGIFNINDALDEAKKKSDSFSTALERDAFMQKTFGARNIVTGQILLDNIDKFAHFTKEVTGTSVAIEQAAINSDTLKAKGKEVADAFKNATTSTKLNSDSLRKVKDAMTFVAENMDKIIGIAFKAIKAFVIFKGVMLTFNTVMAIANIIMAANPIGLIVLGITALIAGVVALIANWSKLVEWVKTSDSAFAKFIRFTLKPIKMLIDGIKGAWQRLRDAFKSGGILGALKSIGKSLLSFMLAPLEAILKVASKLTGGKIGGGALADLQAFRAKLTAPEGETPAEQAEPLNPEAAAAERTQELIQTKNEKVSIEVAAAQGTEARIMEDETNKVQLTGTLGWQG